MDKKDQNKLKEIESELEGKVKEIETVLHQNMRSNNKKAEIKKKTEIKKKKVAKKQHDANKMCLS